MKLYCNICRKDLERQTLQVQNNEAKVQDLKVMLESSKDRIQVNLDYQYLK